MPTTEEIIVDPELAAIIPPLTDEERKALETSLRAEGCRDALVLWKGHDTLLDGHNRLTICRRHGIEHRTIEVAVPDRAAAKVWIIKNQFARRNLTPYQRAELALQLEPAIAEQAKERQRASGGAVVEKSTEPPIKTRVEVAKVAGVSENTIAKAKVIAEEADEPTKAALRRGQTTIHKEFKKIKEAKAEERGDAKPPKPKPLTQVQRLREIARVVKDMDEAFDEKDSDAALFASLRAKVNRLKELLKGVE